MILYIIFLIFFFFFLFLFLVFHFHKKEKEKEEKEVYPCACVFDLDDTITCSTDIAAETIQTCRDNKCLIAFNTARGSPYFEDLKFNKLGLTREEVAKEFYHGNYNITHSFNREGLDNYIAETKVKHLDTISKKYNIPKNKIILFDDNRLNIQYATNYGYATVFANNPYCGLPFSSTSIVSQILD